LPAAGQEFGEGKREHHGAALLCGLGEARAEAHRQRKVDPKPDRVRRFPFALADEKVVGTRGAPPVDARLGVVIVEMAKLPEGLARSCAPAAMTAVGDGMRNALRLDKQRRHARSERVSLWLLGRKRMEGFRRARRQSQITPSGSTSFATRSLIC